MIYTYIEPEVPGNSDDEIKMDTSVHPPIIQRLVFEFDGWSGDCLLASFPCFIMTEAATEAVQKAKLTGVNFDNLIVLKSEMFEEMYPNRLMPKFYWAKIVGVAGQDDFGLAYGYRLVLSQTALKLLTPFGLEQATFYDYPS